VIKVLRNSVVTLPPESGFATNKNKPRVALPLESGFATIKNKPEKWLCH